MLYSTAKSVTGVTDGNANAALQVLTGAVNTGALGKTTKLALLIQAGPPVVYVAVKHPAVAGVKTPEVALIVPPPLTVHFPPVAPPVCVNVTLPPPIQELTVLTTGRSLTITVTVVDPNTQPFIMVVKVYVVVVVGETVSVWPGIVVPSEYDHTFSTGKIFPGKATASIAQALLLSKPLKVNLILRFESPI